MAGRRRPSLWWLITATLGITMGLGILERLAGIPLPARSVAWMPRVDLAVAAVSADEIQSGRPILSLVMDPADLHDPARGILANVMEHGREWERPGSIAFFDKGVLQFGGGVGVRVHGGGSRITSPRQGFRLFFRRQYGSRRLPAGVLFEPDAQPVRRVVVHNDVRDGWHFVNPLAYDIAEEIGAIAPDTYPVRFFLNGEYYGAHVLTERFDGNFFAAHWGYDDIRIDQADFDQLWKWTQETRPLTMPVVASMVNLDSLTRWFLAVAFCATGDAYQGPGQILDLSKDRAAWFWVNWDMDESFRAWDHDSYQYLLNQVDERPRGRNRAEPRSTLLSHLLAEDADYRAFYKRTFVGVMNHRLTQRFLARRYAYYRRAALGLGIEERSYLQRLWTFLEHRVDFFWTLTEQWLNTPPSQFMFIAAPAGETITIDGEPAGGGFQGRYFPDLPIELRAVGDGGGRFVEWRVNGRPAGRTPVLQLSITEPTHVEAHFEGKYSAGPWRTPPAIDPPPDPADHAAATALTWVQLPGLPGEGAAGEPGAVQPPLMMLAHEVTVAAFALFARESGMRLPTQPSWFSGPTHPVMNVTWDEAQAFCAARGGRLPTGAEWDYAARAAGDPTQAFPWGDRFAGEANLEGSTGADQWTFTAPVGSFRPNRFGLFDMVGNLWEWTADLHQSATDGYDVRTVKGASYDTPPRCFPCTSGLSRIGRHNMYVGFRCVR